MAKVNFDPEVAHAEKAGRTGQEVPKVSDLRGDAVEQKPAIQRDAEVFKRNLKFLIECSGWSQAATAEQAKVSSDWMRQLTKRGLSQIRTKNQEPLESLKRLFGLNSIDEFWLESLIDEIKATQQRYTYIRPHLRSKDWTFAPKLLTLLQTGEHDFLRDLIDTLYKGMMCESVSSQGYSSELEESRDTPPKSDELPNEHRSR